MNVFQGWTVLGGKHHPGDLNPVLNPKSFASVSPSSLVDDSHEMSIKHLTRMAMFPWLCRECTSWKARENQGRQALFVPRAVFKHSPVFKVHVWKLISEYSNSFPFSFPFPCPCPFPFPFLISFLCLFNWVPLILIGFAPKLRENKL